MNQAESNTCTYMVARVGFESRPFERKATNLPMSHHEYCCNIQLPLLLFK